MHNTYIHLYLHIHIDTHRHKDTLYIEKHSQTYTNNQHTYMHMHAYVCTHIHMCIYVCICIYKNNTSTHTTYVGVPITLHSHCEKSPPLVSLLPCSTQSTHGTLWGNDRKCSCCSCPFPASGLSLSLYHQGLTFLVGYQGSIWAPPTGPALASCVWPPAAKY